MVLRSEIHQSCSVSECGEAHDDTFHFDGIREGHSLADLLRSQMIVGSSDSPTIERAEICTGRRHPPSLYPWNESAERVSNKFDVGEPPGDLVS